MAGDEEIERKKLTAYNRRRMGALKEKPSSMKAVSSSQPTVQKRVGSKPQTLSSSQPTMRGSFSPKPQSISSSQRTEHAELSQPIRRSEGSGPSKGFGGGPKDTSLLVTYKNHKAKAIWDGEDDGPVKLVHHIKGIIEWPLNEECQLFQEMVDQTGLSNIARYSYQFLYRSMVSAFVERWHPETNTFHLPFGEMTITLDDVEQILGVPIEGEAVIEKLKEDITLEEAVGWVMKGLGMSKSEAGSVMRDNNMGYKLCTLRTFKGIATDDDPVKTAECVRAYLLHLFGSLVFVDKTGNHISVIYLQCLLDLNKKISWGSGILAYLYRRMGEASKNGTRQLACYHTLIQAWICDHFEDLPNFTTMDPERYFDVMEPQMRKWSPFVSRGKQKDNDHKELIMFRSTLDSLTIADVKFNTCDRTFRPLSPVALYRGCLICFGTVAPYHPDRVLWQFGHVQKVPSDPIPSIATGKSSYKVEYPIHKHNWQGWANHILTASVRGEVAQFQGQCSPDYLDWFQGVSHPLMIHSIRKLGLDPHTVSVLKKPVESAVKMCDHALSFFADVSDEVKKQFGNIKAMLTGMPGFGIEVDGGDAEKKKMSKGKEKVPSRGIDAEKKKNQSKGKKKAPDQGVDAHNKNEKMSKGKEKAPEKPLVQKKVARKLIIRDEPESEGESETEQEKLEEERKKEKNYVNSIFKVT